MIKGASGGNSSSSAEDVGEETKMSVVSAPNMPPAALPTLYEYYTSGGVTTGLSDAKPYFTLNDKNITLYSGAMHYFRVPRKYWRDRLRKMRAAGLNAVETYVPWNLHEPEPGKYDFGRGGSDFEDFLHIEEFLKTAQEEDLLAIVRPGPYICSEWEFGGLPSWLLREEGIKVRTADNTFMKHVTRYFNTLLTLLTALQFTKGGPIIAFQIENEYGSTKVGSKPTDKEYLMQLKNLFLNNGIKELLFTSDGISSFGTAGSLPGVLMTANFQGNPEGEFKRLQELQPNKPVMSMEYWTGWFDHWTEQHHTRSADDFENVLKRILDYPASVNMYMFHGGTNWGFMNGANIMGPFVDNRYFQPDTTSYDYDAPLTEAGDYTDKYTRVKNLISKYNKVPTILPNPPAETPKIAYPSLQISEQLTLAEIQKQAPVKFNQMKLVPMEMLEMNNNAGQSYGYIVYRQNNIDIPANAVLKISGFVCDTVVVLINGQLKSPVLEKSEDIAGFGYWKKKDSTLNLGPDAVKGATLELMVENFGRNNFGLLTQFNQHKGLWYGPVTINDTVLTDWDITPLEFKRDWNTKLSGWHKPNGAPGPALYRATLNIDKVEDTFVDMSNWRKGITIVNGFVLGRHAVVGPQQTLYLPAPLLKKGSNEIMVFEHFLSAGKITFSEEPKFVTKR